MGEYQKIITIIEGGYTKLWIELYVSWWTCDCVKVEGRVNSQDEGEVGRVWTGDRIRDWKE